MEKLQYHQLPWALTCVLLSAISPYCPQAQSFKELIPSKIGETIRLGDDPEALPDDRRAQAEPHLARSFTDPNLLVATFQEGRYEDGGAYDNGVAISRDGGVTWKRELIPGLVKNIGRGRYDRASDPVAAIDADGNIYINSLGVNFDDAGEPVSSIVLNSMAPGSERWGRVSIIADGEIPGNFLDKNWMTVNAFPNEQNANRVVVTYAAIIDAGSYGVSPLSINFSDRLGRNWSTTRLFGSPLSQGVQPVFFPDGSLGAVYVNFVDFFSNPPKDRIEYIYSPDGGENFETPSVITPYQPHVDPVARDGSWMPYTTVSRQSGTLFVVYQALDNRSKPSVFFTKSIDKGKTWSERISINDTPNNASIFNPAIAAAPDGQHLTVVFYDKRDSRDPNLVHLYLAESFDGGDTWLPNQRVSKQATNLRLAPLTGKGRMIGDYHGIVPSLSFSIPGYAIWIDTQSGNPDPVVASIHRRQGTTFETWKRLRFAGPDLLDVNISGPDADQDLDGINNLEEYAFGLEPRHQDVAPTLSISLTQETADGVIISFQRLAVLGDIVFQVESSTDLRSWEAVEPLEETTIPSEDPIKMDVSFKLPLSTHGNEFLRIRPLLD